MNFYVQGTAFDIKEATPDSNIFCFLNNDKKLIVRPYQSDDAANLSHAYQAIWAESPAYKEIFSYEEAQGEIEKLEDCWVVVTIEGLLIGFVGGYPLWQHTGPISRLLVDDITCAYWIAELGVLPQYQGHGIGGVLLDALVSQKAVAGADAFLLCTAAYNNPAALLYERRGFKCVLDADGLPITIPVSQMRIDGVIRTDNRVFFYARAVDYVYGRCFAERRG